VSGHVGSTFRAADQAVDSGHVTSPAGDGSNSIFYSPDDALAASYQRTTVHLVMTRL